MSPEGINPPKENQAGFERLMSEYMAGVEAQKERIGAARQLKEKINVTLNLMSLANEMDSLARQARHEAEGSQRAESFTNVAEDLKKEVIDATRDIERYMLQCRRYIPDFTFRAENLPPGSFVVEIDTFRVVEEDVSEFVANDLDVRGQQGINLIDHDKNLRVMLIPVHRIGVQAVFDDKTEEE